MTAPLARFAGERRAIAGLVDPEAAAPAPERADDGALVPVTGEDAAPGNAADRLAARGEQPRAPGVAVDRLSGPKVSGGPQRVHVGARIATIGASSIGATSPRPRSQSSDHRPTAPIILARNVAALDREARAGEFIAKRALPVIALAALGDVAAPAIVKLEARALQASTETLVGAVAPIEGARIVAEGGDGTDGAVIFVAPAKFDLGRIPAHGLILRE